MSFELASSLFSSRESPSQYSIASPPLHLSAKQSHHRTSFLFFHCLTHHHEEVVLPRTDLAFRHPPLLQSFNCLQDEGTRTLFETWFCQLLDPAFPRLVCALAPRPRDTKSNHSVTSRALQISITRSQRTRHYTSTFSFENP